MTAQTMAHTNIGRNINAKNIPQKSDMKIKANGFLTFIIPMTGKIENCNPRQSSIMPNSGTCVTSGMIAPVTSIHADIMARKTISFILYLQKIFFSSVSTSSVFTSFSEAS